MIVKSGQQQATVSVDFSLAWPGSQVSAYLDDAGTG